MSYTTAIDACASVGDALRARELLEEMRAQGVTPNHRSFNAIMSAFAKAGDPQQAIGMLGVRFYMVEARIGHTGGDAYTWT